MSETIELAVAERGMKYSFGSVDFQIKYSVTHWKNKRINTYLVTCEIRGLAGQNPSPYLAITDVEFAGDSETESNDETLTRDGAWALFEEYLEG